MTIRQTTSGQQAPTRVDENGYLIRESDKERRKREQASGQTIGQGADMVYYGGSAGDFVNAVNSGKQSAMNARGRAGYEWDTSNYNDAMGGAAQSRTEQLSGLERMRNLMDTSQSSAASRDVLAGGQQAAQGAQSLATVAKGGLVGQRGAMSQAQQTGGMVQQQAAQQAGILRQQEAANATMQYGQAAASMRAGDAGTRAVALGEAQGVAGNTLNNMDQNAIRERAEQDRVAKVLGAQQASQQGSIRSRMDMNDQQYAIEQGQIAEAQQQQAAAMGAAAAGAGAAVQMAGSAAASSDAYAKAEEARQRQSEHNKRDADNYYSDADLKTAVRSLSDRISSKTPGYSFNYKPGVKGEDPEKRNFGVMAQDLEKTPEGASVVSEGPQGKMVNTGKLALLHQAMMHDFNARLRSLEKKR